MNSGMLSEVNPEIPRCNGELIVDARLGFDRLGCRPGDQLRSCLRVVVVGVGGFGSLLVVDPQS
jgi:hypothetical protein